MWYISIIKSISTFHEPILFANRIECFQQKTHYFEDFKMLLYCWYQQSDTNEPFVYQLMPSVLIFSMFFNNIARIFDRLK